MKSIVFQFFLLYLGFIMYGISSSISGNLNSWYYIFVPILAEIFFLIVFAPLRYLENKVIEKERKKQKSKLADVLIKQHEVTTIKRPL